jgi:hypothetical protein
MKKLLDGLYLSLGTLCLFGLPIGILALAAWFGDSAMGMLHVGGSALHSLSFQAGVVLLMFGTSAGGLILAGGFFALLWIGAAAVNRWAVSLEPLPESAGRRRGDLVDRSVGKIDLGSVRRRPGR